MSAWNITGAVCFSFLAIVFFLAAFTPSEPPAPRYGPTEACSFVFGSIFLAIAIFNIAVLNGAHQ